MKSLENRDFQGLKKSICEVSLTNFHNFVQIRWTIFAALPIPAFFQAFTYNWAIFVRVHNSLQTAADSESVVCLVRLYMKCFWYKKFRFHTQPDLKNLFKINSKCISLRRIHMIHAWVHKWKLETTKLFRYIQNVIVSKHQARSMAY